jgi:hypothetical protein
VAQTFDPKVLKVTKRQAEYLGKTSRISLDKIRGKTYGELEELLRLRVSPALLTYRQICGRVVKKNQMTGAFEGVPNATVHVDDTDCSVVGFFPQQHPYFWLYNLGCRTEELATVTTDECGHFCVWVPRWDIDRFLRWRKRWRCHFVRPRVRDLLPLRPEPRDPLPGPVGPGDPFRPVPRPFPVPAPPNFRVDRHTLETAGGVLDPDIAGLLERAADQGGLESAADQAEAILDVSLFPRRSAAPLPEMLQDLDAFRRALPVEPAVAEMAHPRRVLGPFLRCHLKWTAEWQLFADVPDLTFRVTQDVDGDGTEEEIYTEGLFDVRWDDTSTSNVVLEAEAEAISVPCDGNPVAVACANTASIEALSSMDLSADFHDDTTGYATRINQAHQPGDDFGGSARVMPATSPYCRWLKLHGCVRLDNASHYRLLYRFKADPAGGFGTEQPFLGEAWSAARFGPGAPIPFVPDGQGWYQIVNATDLVEPNWIFYWSTPSAKYADGVYEVRIELGTAAGGGVASGGFSPPRTFVVENRGAFAQFLDVRWRHAAGGVPWASAPVLDLNNCPVIERNPGQAIQLRVQWMASAPSLRSAVLGAHGCGGATRWR